MTEEETEKKPSDTKKELNLKENIVKAEQITFRERDHVIARDGYKCRYCGCSNELLLTIDHMTPQKRGGSSEFDNLVACCYICNQLKGALSEGEFHDYMKSLTSLKNLNKIRLKIGQIKIEFRPYFCPELRGDQLPQDDRGIQKSTI